MSLDAFQETAPWTAYAELQPSNGTDFLDFTPSQRGRLRADMIVVCSTCTADHDVELSIYDGTDHAPVGTVTIPHGAGRSGDNPPIELVTATVKGQVTGYVLQQYYQFSVRSRDAIPDGEVITLTVIGGSL